jgi:hypothetical protein
VRYIRFHLKSSLLHSTCAQPNNLAEGQTLL